MPYPDQKYYSLNPDRCDPCQRRLIKAKIQREMKKKAVKFIESSDDDQDDQETSRYSGSALQKKKSKPNGQQTPKVGKKLPCKKREPVKKTVISKRSAPTAPRAQPASSSPFPDICFPRTFKGFAMRGWIMVPTTDKNWK